MKTLRVISLLAALGFAGAAHAEHPGMALPWQLGLQAPATPVMDRLFELHSALLILITVITIFVLGLLVYVCLRFSARNHPTPSKLTHNTTVEIVWTVIPILILVAIAIPSLRIHYFLDRATNPEMTLKVIGHQWYWEYAYPEVADYSFESHIVPDPTKGMTPDEERAALHGEPRLLTVDAPVVVPVGTVVRVLITSADVIHSWAVPAFGVKLDAIPGRINETWFKAEETGTFRGQCSQLCGIWHGFMPIVVKVVSKEDYAAFVAKNKPAPAANATPGQAATDAQQKPNLKGGDTKAPAKGAAADKSEKKPATVKTK